MSPEEARDGGITWLVDRSSVRLAAADRELQAGVPQLVAELHRLLSHAG